MNKYNIIQVESDYAKTVWRDSLQASIFTNPDVLENLAEKVHWWAILKGEEIQCVWPIVLDESAKPTIAPFSYWQGPLWSKIGFNQPAHRSLHVITNVYGLFIKTFLYKYGSIKASLHPSLQDLRIFDWWNYNSSNQPRFKIQPRYSAVINLDNKNNKIIRSDFRINRRRELTKSKKTESQIYYDIDCTKEELLTLYCKTLNTNITNAGQKLNALYKVIKKGYGWIQALRLKTDHSICGLIIILNDSQQANLVINLIDKQYRNTGLMANSIYKAILFARDKGLKRFDFNGANSPNRGDDKHSYGAEPVLYFDIEYSN